MARPRTPSQRKAYAELRGRMNKYTLLIQKVYDEIAKDAAVLATRVGYDGSAPFRFKDYPRTARAVKSLREKFVGNISSVINASTSKEWEESNLLQDLLATKAMKFYGETHRGVRRRSYFQTNSDALKSFQARRDKGLNLSERIWSQTDEMMRELECAISNAVKKGISATTLSKRVSQYLKDFPSLKSDYKASFGMAVDIHDCEYRSARLARTEINMAYRTAEQLRWRQFDFVVGYEIKLSGAHKVNDICDEAKGKYPKTFKFVGWHPNCYCYCVPILKTEEEFWSDGDVESESEVHDVPDGFKRYVSGNAYRLRVSEVKGTTPYWVRDNKAVVHSAMET